MRSGHPISSLFSFTFKQRELKTGKEKLVRAKWTTFKFIIKAASYVKVCSGLDVITQSQAKSPGLEFSESFAGIKAE